MRGEISVQNYMMASSDEEEAESELDEESDSDPDDEGDDSTLPDRLRRLFKTEDIMKRYGDDWADLPSALISMEYGDEWGTGDMVSPPPPNDPRTHLPRIFKFNGWDCHKLPDFDVRDDQPPQYPIELVSRLRQLHDSGVALQKQDGVEYVVLFRGVDDNGDESSDGMSTDEDEESSNDENSNSHKKSDLDDSHGQVLGRYETLEQANHQAMEALESDSKEYMQYQEREIDESLPDIGLHSFVRKGQEDSLEFDDEGLTWDIDNEGCVMFSSLMGGESADYVVEKRKKSVGTAK
ncbi:hypothetical protein MMC10_008337 [Thelotrema lepadinum]|nr:hypothetical protein [Thelotrema lepadinum]